MNNVGGTILSNCKKILEQKSSAKGNDGIYIINPTGTNPFPVYCDMTTDGGGWTLYTAKAKYGFPDTGYITANTILNNTSYENIMWKYVSPNGKKLPLIYKLFNQKEGRLLLSHWKIKQTEWTNSIQHYPTNSDFANAIKIGDGNTSGVTTSKIRTAINLDNNRFFTARVDGNGDEHFHMGTALYGLTNTKNYLWFPTTPYNSTYRIGTETFNYIF